MAKLGYSRVLLMRSGRTEWDVLGRVQGATDLPMAPAGLEGLKGELKGLEGRELDMVCCGPDEASRATAKLLAIQVGARKTAVVPGLGEMALGLWEGLRHEELESRYCRAGRVFLEDPSGVMAPEGELMEAYVAKVQAAFGQLITKRKAGGSIGIVVRPMALGVLRCLLNNADLGQLWAMLKDRPDVEWYQIPHNDPRLAAPPRRASRSASAA